MYHSTLGWRVITKSREVYQQRTTTGAMATALRKHSSQLKNNHSTEMCSGSEAGSYLRRIDSCITQLKAQGPSRTCNESKEEEELYQQRTTTGAMATVSRAPRRSRYE